MMECSNTLRQGMMLNRQGKVVNATKTRRTKRMSASQRLAILVGSVACFVLALSVWHCTEALCVLTSSPLVLAGLLAIGIDFGMVASELVVVTGKPKARRWAERYVILSVILSAGLNGFASAHQAEAYTVLAAIVGGLVPCLVYILAKVAAYCWRGE
jgi:hypothetical protein